MNLGPTAVRRWVEQYRAEQSGQSRIGKPLTEEQYRIWQYDYANQLKAVKNITEYIVGFYNCVRLRSTLGNLPPLICEKNGSKKSY